MAFFLGPDEGYDQSVLAGVTAALDLTTSGAQPESWPTFTPGDPAPNLVTGDAAYVIAPRLEQTFLYRASTKDTP